MPIDLRKKQRWLEDHRCPMCRDQRFGQAWEPWGELEDGRLVGFVCPNHQCRHVIFFAVPDDKQTA